MNILVTGGNGQLGLELQQLAKNYSNFNFHFTDVADLDMTHESEVESFILDKDIQAIINCAAYTAVDKAEEDRVLADAINHKAVHLLATLAFTNKLRLIHISTDYVFDGKGFRPYQHNHKIDPVNHYGATKYLGEKQMLKINPANSLVIRTSWVYSSHGSNFVKNMMRLGKERETLNVIDDQIGSPTYARDLAYFILEKALTYASQDVGVYHFTNEGVCSWYDFAKEIMSLSGITCRVNPISSADYPTPARRPYYSVMSKYDLKDDFKTTIPYWKDSLQECIQLLLN